MLQSTSLLRGKTTAKTEVKRISPASIHFPLAREDNQINNHVEKLKRFNPLPSCEGRLLDTSTLTASAPLQSTSLLRGKTRILRSLRPTLESFNPLPSCEGRLQISPKITHSYFIILYVFTIQFLIIFTADTNFGVICLLFLHFNGANPF